MALGEGFVGTEGKPGELLMLLERHLKSSKPGKQEGIKIGGERRGHEIKRKFSRRPEVNQPPRGHKAFFCDHSSPCFRLFRALFSFFFFNLLRAFLSCASPKGAFNQCIVRVMLPCDKAFLWSKFMVF